MNDNIIPLQSINVQEVERDFCELVSKTYLNHLHEYTVLPHAKKEGEDVQSTENSKGFRWVKITDIVYNKEEFFVDKFSMLFVALHGVAKQVAVMIQRDTDSIVNFYLGVHDLGKMGDESKRTLTKALKGYFPGINFKEVSAPVFPENCEHVSSVSGIATLKSDNKENFVQGIERLINSSLNSRFTALVIADRLDSNNILSKKNAYEELYCSIAPFNERQFSVNTQISDSISKTLSESFSLSTTNSVGKTITTGINTSEGSHDDDSTSENVNLYCFGEGTNKSAGTNSQLGHHRDVADMISEAVQKSESKNESETKTNSITKGNTIQITLKNRKVQSYLDILEKHIKRLDEALPYGLWSCATYFIDESNTNSKSLANIYRGSIVGEDSHIEECAINSWENQEIINYLRDFSHPILRYNSKILVTPGSIVDSKELAIHLSLPQTSVPGITVKEKTAFGRNVIKNGTSKSEIELGNILHLGQEDKSLKVKLDANELCKHTFITGTTGSGKSNTMYLIVSDLVAKDIPCLIIEPAKGEYKKIFGNIKKDDAYLFEVYGSNPKTTELLRINPFEFPKEIHVYEHIDRLVDIFNACWPMYAAMPVVLKKSICDAYEKCGWDLIKSEWIGDKCNGILYPTIKDVVISLRDFINSSEYSDNTKGDYKGSIETRLVSLSEGLTGTMLNNTNGNLEDEQLFEKNVIIDLSKIGNSETKSLLMGLVIMKMTEYYQSHDTMNSELKHVTIMEEAHNLLKRTSTAQSQESNNLAGKSVEMICNSIAEMRTYGEGFIIVDQSPSQVDMAAIRNTNTKIIMALPDYEDRTVAGKSIGLTDNQIEEIGNQSVGQAVVYQNDWEEAVQCKIIDYNDKRPKDIDDKFIPRNANNESYYDNDKNGRLTILKFLYRYCGGKMDSPKEDIHDVVFSVDMPSIIKYRLLGIMQRCGTPSDKQRQDAIELAANVIGGIDAVSRLMCNRKNEKELFSILQDSLEKDFPGEEKDFYRFCMRSILRVQASLSSKNVETYNNWFRINYGTNN